MCDLVTKNIHNVPVLCTNTHTIANTITHKQMCIVVKDVNDSPLPIMIKTTQKLELLLRLTFKKHLRQRPKKNNSTHPSSQWR